MADECAPGGLDRRTLLRAAVVGAGAVATGVLRAPVAAAALPSATEARFDHLDGTPLLYWRWTNGTAGQGPRRRTFASTGPFHDRLVRWVRDLRGLAALYGGLRHLDAIVTAGVFVDKPGQHGLGQAFDLDEVRWSNGTISPYAREHLSTDRRVLRRYLALDAVCRRHFRYVLDGRYNAAHADHLHMDFGGGVVRCDRTSRSDTVFVQQVLNSHQGARLQLTGRWGSATQAAFDESRRRLGVTGDPTTSTDAWRTWLVRVAACGFADLPFAAPPPEALDPLLDPLADLVDDLLNPQQDRLAERLGLLQ